MGVDPTARSLAWYDKLCKCLMCVFSADSTDGFVPAVAPKKVVSLVLSPAISSLFCC